MVSMGLYEKFNFVQRLKRSQAVTQVDILGERILSQGDSQWKGSETEECFEYKEQQGGQCNWRGGNEIKSSRRGYFPGSPVVKDTMLLLQAMRLRFLVRELRVSHAIGRNLSPASAPAPTRKRVVEGEGQI